MVLAGSNGYTHEVLVSGVSGDKEPNWADKQGIIDGSIIWKSTVTKMDDNKFTLQFNGKTFCGDKNEILKVVTEECSKCGDTGWVGSLSGANYPCSCSKGDEHCKDTGYMGPITPINKVPTWHQKITAQKHMKSIQQAWLAQNAEMQQKAQEQIQGKMSPLWTFGQGVTNVYKTPPVSNISVPAPKPSPLPEPVGRKFRGAK
jgi:hypothetical protein